MIRITYLALFENQLQRSVAYYLVLNDVSIGDFRRYLTQMRWSYVIALHKRALNNKWPTLGGGLYLGGFTKSRFYHYGSSPIPVPMKLPAFMHSTMVFSNPKTSYHDLRMTKA